MLFEKFIYDIIDSNMYIATVKNNALIIDPNVNNKALELLIQRKITEVLIILTHEHYDHISGVEWLRKNFKCTVLCSDTCAENIQSEIKNGSKFFSVLFLNQSIKKLEEAKKVKPMTCKADKTFSAYISCSWMGYSLELYKTPGHSSGSSCIIFNKKYIFTGDTLLKDKEVITKLPTGNKDVYFESTVPFLKSLNKDLLVCPGHGEGGSLCDLLF